MLILARFGDASQGRTWLYRSARELQERDAPGDAAGGGDTLAAEGLTHEARADIYQDDAGLGLALSAKPKRAPGSSRSSPASPTPTRRPRTRRCASTPADLTPDLAAHRILIKLESLGFIR